VLPAENAARLEAARVLDGLRRGKNGNADAVRRLETALGQDDLESMARLAGELRGSVAAGPLGRPAVRIVLAGLAVVLLAGAVWFWRSRSGGPTDYLLRLDPAHQAAGPITLALVRDGRVEDRQTYDPASGATFRLAPGEYEVFVNDRYTGRTIRAPTDPREVTMIPVPPAP